MCKPTRTSKPLAPVAGTCRWLNVEVNGNRRLEINGTAYELADLGGLGWRLYRFLPDGTSTAYDIDPNAPGGWSCDCPDGTYRPNRPGGCKHVRALQTLLAQSVAA